MEQIKPHLNQDSKDDEEPDAAFDLGDFFPYLVRIFYRSVNEVVSSVYTQSYGLTVSQWRTMAVLGPYNAMSASQIVSLSSMDKVNVSRAIKGLQTRGLLKRDIDGDDRRRAVLRLTEKGRHIFHALVPLVKQAEEKCLQDLSAQERSMLISLMERVRIATQSFSPDTNVAGHRDD